MNIAKGNETKLVMYKCIREFFENESDPCPNNYMVVVTNYTPTAGE